MDLLVQSLGFYSSSQYQNVTNGGCVGIVNPISDTKYHILYGAPFLDTLSLVLSFCTLKGFENDLRTLIRLGTLPFNGYYYEWVSPI